MYIDSKSLVYKNNIMAISFLKQNHKIIKSTVTPLKQSLIQHYTSSLSHTNEAVHLMYAHISQDIKHIV